jgi:Phosphatase 4 regulatory subunit 3
MIEALLCVFDDLENRLSDASTRLLSFPPSSSLSEAKEDAEATSQQSQESTQSQQSQEESTQETQPLTQNTIANNESQEDEIAEDNLDNLSPKGQLSYCKKALGNMCELFHWFVLLNSTTVFEILFSNDIFDRIFGVLEYDPAHSVNIVILCFVCLCVCVFSICAMLFSL